jgi:hypothetical protein
MRLAQIILAGASMFGFGAILGSNYKAVQIDCTHPEPRVDTVYIEKRDSIYKLIDAIIHVESRNLDSAVNRRTNAVGCMQIRPIMVDEVNRILRKKQFPLAYDLHDRYKRDKSLQMFYIWKAYHHRKSNLETIARCWNGGTNGENKQATYRYWVNVKRRMKNEKQEV